jgi:AcrR family transcriptional regulator
MRVNPAEPSRREQAKSGRRARIIEAAHDLLREVDMEGVSVKAIAQCSGLSPATVYNLFGTKGAVLAQVFDLDLQAFERRVAGAGSQDGLDRFFDAIAIAADLYRSDPNFYRLTMVARGGVRADPRLAAIVREPRVRFWRGLVQQAIDEGALRPDADAAALGIVLVQITAGALLDWAADVTTADQLEIETSFGFAAALASFAAKPAQIRLRRRMTMLSEAIVARSRAA